MLHNDERSRGPLHNIMVQKRSVGGGGVGGLERPDESVHEGIEWTSPRNQYGCQLYLTLNILL
jgi:hypothetical protein